MGFGFRIGVSTAACLCIATTTGWSLAVASASSDSYEWGQMAGNSAVQMVLNGVQPRTACKAAIETGAMFADSPILNPTPPPEDFDLGDAMDGCMDQLEKRIPEYMS
jgi:hypothetical protein